MLVVKVELWGAVTGERKEIARMVIANDGTGSDDKGNYWAKVMKGRDTMALSSQMLNMLRGKGTYKTAEVKGYPRHSKHVWNLVAEALEALDYGRKNRKSAAVPGRAV